MDKTKVKLRICDIDCTITSDDNEEYVRTIGDEIDRAISAVLKKNDRISLSMAAIITAMTYCDESAKAKAELAELKTLDKNRSNEYERLKQAAETAQTEAGIACIFNRRQRFGKNAAIQKCTGCGKSKPFSGTKQGFFRCEQCL